MPSPKPANPAPDRAIIHLDMDAFYASVEVLDCPELADKPVIVGGQSDRGVVSAASYAAREFGIHAAMAVVVARRLCPQGIFRPPRLSRYQEISQQIMAIFADFSPLVEQISIDEAFIDVTGCDRLLGTPAAIAQQIRQRVRHEIGLTVSAGIARNKLVAKIASDQHKPDGLTVVPAGEESAFLAPLPIKRLWGVGRKTIPRLKLLGVETIGDLCRLDLNFLEKSFGKQGRHMYFCARGIDKRAVEITTAEKSLGNETTFAHDLTDLQAINKELLFLATKVGERLRRHDLQGRVITIKIKYSDFRTVSRALTLSQATADHHILYETALILLTRTEAGRRPVRLAGISVSTLISPATPRQLNLFHAPAEPQRQHLLQALDTINQRYGSFTIKPGTLAQPHRQPPDEK